MRDPNELPDRLWRANRIGLRTLGQRPQALGQTREGQQIFEVRAARLLLGSTSTHFRRLVECSQCKREVAGPAVLSREDLEVPVPPTICGHCSGRVMAWRAEQAVEPDEDKVDAVNELVRRATGAPAQVSDLQEQAPGLEVRAEIHTEAPLTSSSESTATGPDALADQARHDVAGLAAVVDSQTKRTAALAVSVDSNRAALRQVVELQQKTDMRLADLEARSAGAEPDATAVAALQQPISEIRTLAEALRVVSSSAEATAARTQHEVGQLREAVSKELAEIRRDVALRDQQVNVALSNLRAMVAALRSDLETSAHGQLDQLAALAEQHGALCAGVETLTAAVRGGELRAQFLERRVEDAMERLSERLDDQRKELAEEMERATQVAAAGAPTGRTPGADPLLDALDDQLRAVEARLAIRATKGP